MDRGLSLKGQAFLHAFYCASVSGRLPNQTSNSPAPMIRSLAGRPAWRRRVVNISGPQILFALGDLHQDKAIEIVASGDIYLDSAPMSQDAFESAARVAAVRHAFPDPRRSHRCFPEIHRRRRYPEAAAFQQGRHPEQNHRQIDVPRRRMARRKAMWTSDVTLHHGFAASLALHAAVASPSRTISSIWTKGGKRDCRALRRYLSPF